MIQKAAQSEADVVCLDLEDSIMPAQKVPARQQVIESLQTVDFGQRLRMVRINALDTPFAYRDIIDVVEKSGDRLDLIMLPKCESAHHVQFLDTLLTQIEANVGLRHPIGIEAQIETAASFVSLQEIASSSSRLEALIFGAGDYAASMQMPLANIGEPDAHDAHYPGHRWHGVMHAIVAHARNAGLRCLDGPYANFKDSDGLANTCRTALALGFDGKQCIHPQQLATVNTMFAPTADELEWAQKIVQAVEEAEGAGSGVVAVDGHMVDFANQRMAAVILNRQQVIETKEAQQ